MSRGYCSQKGCKKKERKRESVRGRLAYVSICFLSSFLIFIFSGFSEDIRKVRFLSDVGPQALSWHQPRLRIKQVIDQPLRV